jgi:hypothetical protein
MSCSASSSNGGRHTNKNNSSQTVRRSLIVKYRAPVESAVLVAVMPQPNVMCATRNDLTKRLWTKLLLLAAALALLSGSAFAQMSSGAPIHHGGPQSGPTREDQERKKQIDKDYNAATKHIPDQKPADPWADMRSAPAASSSKKNPQ